MEEHHGSKKLANSVRGDFKLAQFPRTSIIGVWKNPNLIYLLPTLSTVLAKVSYFAQESEEIKEGKKEDQESEAQGQTENQTKASAETWRGSSFTWGTSAWNNNRNAASYYSISIESAGSRKNFPLFFVFSQ